jgi:hypothetical protein
MVVTTQGVSRRLPIAAARVRAQIRSCGICGGQSGIEAGFLRVLRFPRPILIPPTAPHSPSSIMRGWYSRPNSCRHTKWSLTPPQETRNQLRYVTKLGRKVNLLFMLLHKNEKKLLDKSYFQLEKQIQMSDYTT